VGENTCQHTIRKGGEKGVGKAERERTGKDGLGLERKRDPKKRSMSSTQKIDKRKGKGQRWGNKEQRRRDRSGKRSGGRRQWEGPGGVKDPRGSELCQQQSTRGEIGHGNNYDGTDAD